MRLVRPVLALLALLCVTRSSAAHDWNDREIRWRPLEAGLAEAKKTRKPVCVVVFTEWCPHCAAYAKLFRDPKLVEKSKRFVMVRIDKDKERAAAAPFNLDGDYIPRTLFVRGGAVDPAIHARRTKYLYFYDERNPADILGAMDQALSPPAKRRR